MTHEDTGALKKQIQDLKLQLDIEKQKNKALSDRADIGIWEYIIAEKKLVQSRKLEGKWSESDLVVPNYREQVKAWGVVFSEDIDIFDAYCDSMDAGEAHILYEYRCYRDDLQFVWLRMEGNTICDDQGKPIKVIGSTIDITREKQGNALLERETNKDMLTGLYSRDVAGSMITQKLMCEPSTPGALLIIDLDDFKSINDLYGKLYGDKILEAAAEIIYTSFKVKDIKGRLAGDEFIVYCSDVENEAVVHKLINRLMLRFQEFLVHGSKKAVSMSVGAVMFPESGRQFEELYSKADIALFHAKNRGKNQYCVYRNDVEYETSIGETYRKMMREDKKRAGFETKGMNMNKELFDFAFDVISREEDLHRGVQTIFEEVSLYFMIDRCTLMEYDKIAGRTHITAKWAREDDGNDRELIEESFGKIWSLVESYYKDLEYSILDSGKALGQDFSDDMTSMSKRPVTALQFPIMEDQKMACVLTFDNWKERQWRQVEIATLSSITKMISSYLLRKQTKEELQAEYYVGKRAMDVQNLLYYIIDQDNYQIQYMSHYARESFPKAQIGQKCYQALMEKEEPCKDCPIPGCGEQKEINTVESYNEEEDSWYTLTAALMGHQSNSSERLICRSDVTAFLNRVKGFDQLTGAMSYEKFRVEAVKKIRKSKEPHILLFSGIQDFSRINDEYGYEIGDRILKLFADTFQSVLQEGELLCRIKGDDFAFLMKQHSAEWFQNVRKEYSEYFTEVFRIQCPDISINCFAGACEISEEETHISQCLDKAMKAKKEALKNLYAAGGIYFYSQEVELWEREREEMNRTMRESLAKGYFKVFFQPKVDVITNAIIGAEALVRLIGSDGRMIAPGKFIPLAEENGLVVEIDNFVYEETFRMMRRWIDEGREVPLISVNLSRRHLFNDNLPKEMKALSSKYGLKPEQIELEITESVFFEDTERLVRMIGRMKEVGYVISMDDFGAGFSTLSLMKSLPMDVIKIDGGFFKQNELDRKSRAVIASIMQLANNLEFKTVSEGVETKEQIEFIRDNGGRYVQGYYFYKPMPADEFEKLLKPSED